MAQARRHILPFFIPHLGCPQQCIFCDQRRIAGRQRPPTAEEVALALAGLPDGLQPELAFYGGSFTALGRESQIYYLEPAREALRQGRISGIRVSTRPDCIDAETLALLAEYGVGTVELGVQSMSDPVLARAKRGHKAADSLAAVRLLQQVGFCCGVQLMPGLPGETEKSAVAGAEEILALRPDMLRIYPTVVLPETELAELLRQGEYAPMSLDAAARVSLYIKLLAEELGVQVIRIGLQPTEELGEQVLAGPYHPAFGELVLGLYSRCKATWLLRQAEPCSGGILYCSNRDISAVVGQKRQNLAHYRQLWPGIRVKPADLLPGELRLEAAGQAWGLRDEDFRVVWRQSPELTLK